jgi:hypothetical protein
MLRRIVIGAMLVLGLLLVLSGGLSSLVMAGDDPGEGAPLTEPNAAQARVEAAFAQLPLYFIENRGQVDERAAYYVQGKDKTLYFTSEGVTFVLSGEDTESPAANRWVLKLGFVGANPEVQPVGRDETGALISYFRGRPEEWETGLKAYSKVVYRDLWPGIDLQYSGTVSRLKYQFVVKPGADPSRIRLAYLGATEVMVNEAGQLQVSTPVGGFHDDVPYAYQLATDGPRLEVDASYAFQRGADEEAAAYGFRVGAYDPTKVLILDPTILVYCGYIGGSGSDSGNDIAVDSVGNAYVVGTTDSTAASFPDAIGPDLTHNGDEDAFVAKVNPAGTGLIYCGYIGGSGPDRGEGIAVDDSGNAYVTGSAYSTESSPVPFPVTVGPDITHNGSKDAFVAKVNPVGTGLVYCGYVGGFMQDLGQGIAVDGSGNAYVAGGTQSSHDDAVSPFPVTVGPDLTYGGYGDAFVARVKGDGTGLVYCGYIGGSDYDHAYSIAIHSGNAYVTGDTSSSEFRGFPLVVGPDLIHNGWPGQDAFVAKVRADGTAFSYCGYVGGSQLDSGRGIAVDGTGHAYVSGYTYSTEAQGFPVSIGPDLTHAGGSADAYVAKVKADGTALDYCGYIGGSNWDQGTDIAVDGIGNAYVTGFTDSSETQRFPVMVGPDTTHNGNEDAFLARVAASGTWLDYCGYIGGSGWEQGSGIATHGPHNAYVTGYTDSAQDTFPETVGPDLSYNGDPQDAFVAKVFSNQPPMLGAVAPSIGRGPAGVTTYFTTDWRDPDGWQDLKQCYLHIGASPSLVSNVTLLYNAKKNKIWLRSDDGTAWVGGVAPGADVVLENGQARVHCALTIGYATGDTLWMQWAIEFKPAFTGTKKTGLKCKDIYGGKAKGEWRGTWTIE